MLQRAVYLRKAIDLWTRSKSQYKKLILNEHEWEMIEFLVHFLHPFQIITTLVQGTSKPSLHDVWVKYEEMFDKLDEVKKAINEMTIRPIWLREVQVAIEKMWEKLGDYYSKTGRPFAFIDATLLHPALKVSFMRKANYEADVIESYKRDGEKRFYEGYEGTQPPQPSLQRGKRPRPTWDSDSSDDEQFNEFTNYIDSKRDKSVKDPLQWWSKSQSIFPKLSKMARDVYAVPATGAGVEREFSISGRVITKQRNRLNPSTIRDVMQYKRWVARHGMIADPLESLETDETEDQNQEVLLEDDENVNSELVEWLKAWEKKEKWSQRVKRLVVM